MLDPLLESTTSRSPDCARPLLRFAFAAYVLADAPSASHLFVAERAVVERGERLGNDVSLGTRVRGVGADAQDVEARVRPELRTERPLVG